MKYDSSSKLIDRKPSRTVADGMRESRSVRRTDFIEAAMSNQAGQEFMHDLIFDYMIEGVGRCGLLDSNIDCSEIREGIRSFQSQVELDTRRFAKPSDYKEMLMRALGGKRPDNKQEEED